MKKHLTRIGMGLLGTGAMVVIAAVIAVLLAFCVGAVALLLAFPVALKGLFITALVLTFCYFVGRDMEKKS